MKIVGVINTNNMTIEVDGEEKNLATLLSDFNACPVDIMIKTKDEEELDEPDEPDEPEDSEE